MKQKLVEIGKEITSLINIKLQEQRISKEDYLQLLNKIELIINKEQKTINGEIIEIL